MGDYGDFDEDITPESEIFSYPAPGSNPSLRNITFQFELTPDIEVAGVTNIEVRCLLLSKEIGSLSAKLFEREALPYFQDTMDEISDKCQELASTLFDKRGLVRREWIHDPTKKGSGVWTKDMGSGDFVLVESIIIDMEHRRKAFGKAMMKALINETETRGARHAFMWPAQLNYAPDAAKGEGPEAERVLEENISRAIAFARSRGFRRVGTTCWFCYAMGREDASRKLAWDEDFDPIEVYNNRPPESSFAEKLALANRFAGVC